MKKKSAKAPAKDQKRAIGSRAVRDLELMDPAAKKLKGGFARIRPRGRGDK
jgi:hypothetical protein